MSEPRWIKLGGAGWLVFQLFIAEEFSSLLLWQPSSCSPWAPTGCVPI
jgi:hypothetical protein